MHNLKGKTVLVLGFAKTGKSVTDFLLEHEVNVILNDNSDLDANPNILSYQNQNVQIIGKGHPLSILDKPIDFIVKNPGIPYQLDLIQKALDLKIPIYTDVELFYWFNSGNIIGITGSNGKTTTSTLIDEILTNSDINNHLAGNIGIPTLSILPQIASGDWTTMELSSFQLMGTKEFRANIAVITNFAHAHLDYHASFDEYINAKLNLIDNQKAEDFLVYNVDDSLVCEKVKNTSGQLVPFSLSGDENICANGAYLKEGVLYFKEEPIIDSEDILLPGAHNIQNILAAICVAKLLNIDNQVIKKTITQFSGVAYRIQPIATKSGIRVYNDSKATNAEATITALKSFKEPFIYIGGGLDRGVRFDELLPYLTYCKKAVLYGQSKEKLAEVFAQANISDLIIVETLEQAVDCAIENIKQKDIILFSPANASWDQFPNFEVRGETFTNLIKEKL